MTGIPNRVLGKGIQQANDCKKGKENRGIGLPNQAIPKLTYPGTMVRIG